MGNERLGKEEKLGDFCGRNGLIEDNTWFMKKNSHKITRYGWGERRTKAVIDYFLVEKKNRRQLMDGNCTPKRSF